LVEARGRKSATLDGIENAQEMLAFAKNDLRSARGFSGAGIANQVGTSHFSITP